MNFQEIFDKVPERRGSNAAKWQAFDADVLPMWVADMDFPAPPGVITALQERVSHGIFGYPEDDPGLIEVICDWLRRRFGWTVPPESIVLLPGVVPGFNMAAQMLDTPQDGLLIQTPVYPPFLQAAARAGARSVEMQLTTSADGSWVVDLDRFRDALKQDTGMFLLCNPHNPVGRVFSGNELSEMAALCLEHDALIISDEIHADLIFSGHRHIPIASISPEIAGRTITLMAPSKTFNIAGLQSAFAVITDPALRKRFRRAGRGLVSWINVLGQTAAKAAYTTGEVWLSELLVYLEQNRDLLMNTLRSELPSLRLATPEGTYLAWIDCRPAGLGDQPAAFFQQHGRVAFNEGDTFGGGGTGFVRLNFGCPRTLLMDGLRRMTAALQRQIDSASAATIDGG